MSTRSKKDKITKVFVGVLLVAATAGFIFSDVSQYMRTDNNPAVRYVGSKAIRMSDIFQEKEAVMQELGNIPQSDALKIEVYNRSIENLTLRHAISEYAQSLGITVPPASIDDVIRSIGAFKTLNGQFDENKFKQILYQQKISVSEFKKNIADGVLREVYLKPSETEFSVPISMSNIVTFLADTQLTIDGYHVDYNKLPQSFKKIKEPTTNQLKEIYNQQKITLIRPQLKDIEYIVFNDKTLKDKIIVSDNDVTSFYKKNKENLYFQPEERRVSQIIAKSQEDAEKVLKKLENGSSFIASAEDAGYPASDIDLGYVTRQAFNDDVVADMVFSMDVGNISKPTKTEFGYALFFVEAIRPQNIKDFKEVEKEIYQKLFSQRLTEYLGDIIPSLEDDLAGGASLAEVSKKYGSVVKQEKNIQMDGKIYNAQDNRYLDNIIPLEYLSVYQPSEDIPIIQDKNGYYAVMKVISMQPQRILSFDEAKDKLREDDLNSQKKMVVDNVMMQLKSASDKTSFAKNNNIIKKTHLVKRIGETPQELSNENLQDIIYAKKIGDNWIAPISDTEALFAIVTKIKNPEKTDKTLYAEISNKLQASIKNTVQEQTLELIKKQVKIETDQKALAKVYAR